MSKMTRRTVLAGAAGALSCAMMPVAVGETGMSAGFVQLRAQLATSLAAYEETRRALDAVMLAVEAHGSLVSDEGYDALWDRENGAEILEACQRHGRAVRETIAAIFTRLPVTPMDERAIMDAIELYEAEWWDAGVLRDAPRAFFTPPPFQDPSRAWEMALHRDHFLDPDTDFEKSRTLPPYLASLRAAQRRVQERADAEAAADNAPRTAQVPTMRLTAARP